MARAQTLAESTGRKKPNTKPAKPTKAPKAPAKKGAAKAAAKPDGKKPIPKRAADSAMSAAVWKHVDELTPWEKNPRINEEGIPKVEASLRRFGFAAPVVTWRSKHDRLVAGHTRWLATKAILEKEPDYVFEGAPAPGFIPVREHEFKNESEATAYAIADNRLAYESDWDYSKLVPLLDGLKNDAEEALLGLTGFDPPELEALTKSQWGEGFEGPSKGNVFTPTGGKPADGEGEGGGSQRPPADPNFTSIRFAKADWERIQAATETVGKKSDETVHALMELLEGDPE